MYVFKNKITLEARPVLEQYLGAFEYKTSGLSYSALYMWRDINEFSWQIIGEYLCITGVSHLELEEGIILPFMFPPLTKTGTYEPAALRETLYEAKRIFEEQGYPFSLRLVPFHMLSDLNAACPGQIRWTEDRPNYDYVYRTSDLATYAGREFHAKKNHLNYFYNHFEYQYIPLTSCMADEAMEFIAAFNAKKEIPENEMALLKWEEDATRDVFNHLESVGYLSGAIRIDGKIQALTVAGRLGKNAVTVHIEKANAEYRGLYQAISNEFAKSLPDHIRFINREEDMGIPNLRKAKLSLNPCKLVEKHIGIFK